MATEEKNETQDKAPKEAKYLAYIEDEGGANRKEVYLRALNKFELGVVLSMIMPSSGQPDYIGAGEVILKNCALPGADLEELLADTEGMDYVSMCFQAYQIVQLKTGAVKKL